MYSSRGSGYGQQQYGSQSEYGQNLGSGYPGSSASGAESGSQNLLSSRHPSIKGAPQETDIGGYGSHLPAANHYRTQYGSVYGSNSVSSSQPLRTNGLGSSVSGYVPTLPDSPKFSSGSYLSPSSRGYGQKGDDLYSDKLPGYIPIDRRQYAKRSSAYIGRELQNEPSSRYADSSNFGHQTDLYGRTDQASLLRGEQLLKIQSLHTSSVDGGVRQANYLTERSSALRHSDQEAMHYGGRLESDPHGLSVRNTSYASQHNPSLLGAVPRQNLDDYIYVESSSNPGYGVSLPPGRDYGIGKGIHSAASLDLDYPGGILARDGGDGLHIDNLRKDDRASYLREFELREEERRRDNLRSRDKEREREREREHEREREYERERERQRELERQKSRDRERERMLERREKERERERERKLVLEVKRNQTPAGRAISKDRKEQTPVPKSISRDARSSSLLRDPQLREASTRRSSPIKPIRRDYICKVSSSRLVDTERDYLTLEKRYPRLFVPSDLSKVVVNWPKHKLTLSMYTAVSFEHDYIEDDGVDVKSTSTKSSALETGGKTVWNAKMVLMSGLSRTALEDLSSDKSFEDWVPHICNILKFAVLKKDHTLMGIGGSWDPTDGRDPSNDQSSLIQTMLRHSKDKLNLDLSNCRHWNPFLEIHYDRVGSDGVFNCKEITVLFVPDLSECLPSFDAWRTQWLTYREALTERDRLLSQEIKKATIRGKGSSDTVEVTKDAEKKSPGDTSGTPRTATKKTVKKIIKRVVTKPVNDAKENGEKGEKSDEKDVPEKVAISDTTAPKEESTCTSSNKNLAKGKVAENDDNMDVDFKKDDVSEEKKVAEAGKKTPDSGSIQMKSTGKSLEEVKDKNASRTVEIKQNTGSLDTEKKEGHSSSCKKDIKTDENKKAENKITTETQSEGKKIDRNNDDEKKLKERGGIDESRIQGKDRKTFEEPPRPGFILLTKRNKHSKLRSLSVSLDSLLDYSDKDTDESSFELSLFAETLFEMLQYQMGSRILEFLKKLRVKSVRQRNRRKRPPKAVRQRNQWQKQREELLVKQNEEKSENKRQKTVEQKDKETSVTIKCTPGKDDTENPTKETVDRCQEISDKEALSNTKATLRCKEVIGDEVADRQVDNQDEDDDADDDGGDDNPEKDLEDDPEEDIEGDPEEGIEEDPEEDPEECKKMDIANSEKEDPTEEKREEKLEKTSDTITDPKAEAETDREEERSRIDQTTETKPISEANKHMKQERGTPNAALKREQTVDKELLQAFRFFDRNQAGYVRVEDMRKTIHSLGQFLSHREVKELVHSALLESNTGRDDRILYNKLVRLSF